MSNSSKDCSTYQGRASNSIGGSPYERDWALFKLEAILLAWSVSRKVALAPTILEVRPLTKHLDKFGSHNFQVADDSELTQIKNLFGPRAQESASS